MTWKDILEAVYLWLYALLSAAIVGFSHAALVVLGGAAVTSNSDGPIAQSAHQAAVDPHALARFCLIGAVIRVCDYLDDHPLPVFAAKMTVKTTVTAESQEVKPT